MTKNVKIHRLTAALIAAVGAIFLVSCGELTHEHNDYRTPQKESLKNSIGPGQTSAGQPTNDPKNSSQPTPSASPTPGVSPSPSPSQSPKGESTASSQRAPVETFLVGLAEVPARIKATRVQLHFRSNYADAVFTCRDKPYGLFAPCTDLDGHTWNKLRNGQIEALWVRAETPSKQVDHSPIKIGFVIDQNGGQTLEQASAATQDSLPAVAADNLPKEQAPPSDEGAVIPSRSVLVGSFYGLTVPWNMRVISYSTNKTYNSGVRMLRDQSSVFTFPYVFATGLCNLGFQRLMTIGDRRVFCESTPTTPQIDQVLPPMSSANHVLMSDPLSESETLAVESIDANDIGTAAVLPTKQSLCTGAVIGGTIYAPFLNRFYGVVPGSETFYWCDRVDGSGRHWWAGNIRAQLSKAATSRGTMPPVLSIVYAIRAGGTLSSGQEFASRAAAMISKLVVPIAPIDSGM